MSPACIVAIVVAIVVAFIVGAGSTLAIMSACIVAGRTDDRTE